MKIYLKDDTAKAAFPELAIDDSEGRSIVRVSTGNGWRYASSNGPFTLEE